MISTIFLDKVELSPYPAKELPLNTTSLTGKYQSGMSFLILVKLIIETI